MIYWILTAITQSSKLISRPISSNKKKEIKYDKARLNLTGKIPKPQVQKFQEHYNVLNLVLGTYISHKPVLSYAQLSS